MIDQCNFSPVLTIPLIIAVIFKSTYNVLYTDFIFEDFALYSELYLFNIFMFCLILIIRKSTQMLTYSLQLSLILTQAVLIILAHNAIILY